MPRNSERKKAMKALEHSILLDKLHEYSKDDDAHCWESDFIDSEAEQEDEDDPTSPLLIRVYLENLRYLDRSQKVPKSQSFLRDILPNLDEQRYREEVRVSRATFDKILEYIQTDAVFRNESDYSQATISDQLTVALYRFGSYGTNASIGKVARHFGISEGTVEDYTRRVISALLSVEREVVTWPGEERREAIKAFVKNKFYFRNCIGFVDGTDIVLEFKPNRNGEDYWNRKRRFSLAAMIVCDHERRIIYSTCGFTGSAHDSRVLKNSRMHHSSADFFQNQEYVLADSAYACAQTVVSPYRRSATASRKMREFNKWHSKARVAVEHCIGMLKGRFQCLRGLRISIKSRADHARAVLWYRACTILHNICVDNQEGYDKKWDDDADQDLDEEENLIPEAEANDTGAKKRDRLANYIWAELFE